MKKNILMTGCSSGIGLCAAQTLQQRGYRVFAGVRKEADQQRLQDQGIQSVLLDVNDSQSIIDALNSVLIEFGGRLDALCNNAGFAQPGAVEDISRAALRAQFETNVFGLQELTNRVIPIMRKQGSGRIINISSVLGFVSMAYRGAYCASKYAVEALSDALRLELEGSGIRVILIEPGPIVSAFRDTARIQYEQHVDVDNSIHQASYACMMKNIEQMKETSRFTLQPDSVVQKIIHALESPRPKIRYYVTLPTYGLAILKRLLPSACFELILRKIYRSETRPEKS